MALFCYIQTSFVKNNPIFMSKLLVKFDGNIVYVTVPFDPANSICSETSEEGKQFFYISVTCFV